MFKSSDGLFHFVFANQNDVFFTNSYLKLRFKPFLNYCLKQKEYEHIYYFDYAENSYTLTADGAIIVNDTAPETKKTGIMAIFRKKNEPAEKRNYLYECTAGKVTLAYDECADALMDILKTMENVNNMAVVIPVGVFNEVCTDRKIVKQLEKLDSNRIGSKNIIVIKSSCMAVENNSFFVCPKLMRGSDGDRSSSAFYQCAELFPEFQEAHIKNQNKLVVIYDSLKYAFRERMTFWNNIDLNNIVKIVNYNLMHNMDISGKYYPPELYAVIIFIWYTRNEFRAKYRDIMNLPENDLCCNGVIDDIMAKNKITAGIVEKIALSEGTEDYNEILKKWAMKNGKINIYDNLSAVQLKKKRNITGYIMRFNDLIAMHPEKKWNEEERELLYNTEVLFRKQVYISRVCSYSPPHEYLTESEDNIQEKIIRQAFELLENTGHWQAWEKFLAEMIFGIFTVCMEDIENKDTFSSMAVEYIRVYVKGLQKGFSGLEKRHGNTENEKKTVNELFDRIQDIVYSENIKEIANFINS